MAKKSMIEREKKTYKIGKKISTKTNSIIRKI